MIATAGETLAQTAAAAGLEGGAGGRAAAAVQPRVRPALGRQEVGARWIEAKRFVHPQLGRLDLHCQTLLDVEQGHLLLVFTANPGTEDAEEMALLAVLGSDRFPVG